ncbi:hypothetical protein SAMN02910344_02256 [Ruminobacter amylophilus]|uniref:Uncharacterized protein n=1 Tax=Ruminobacter amylophilus TaxID=867 RepID=A0A662ZK65_9GAMM|nr:hypothetical protein [Ruminobacter amylophilus]SFP76637.1 hypothetical protein SAMN02910344_02256 [Ruminobacter amylophilus]
MKVFEWIPNKSIGDLIFNMTRDEARKVMGKAVYIPWFKGRSDFYDEYSIRLDYDENGLLEAVEFLGMEKGFFEVWYKGKLIYPKYEKHFFRIFDKKLFKSDDTSSYQYNGLNVSVTWNKDYGPSFGVAREHYWDDSDKRIEECFRLDKLSFKLKPDMTREETREILKEKSDKLMVRGRGDIYSRYLLVIFDENDRMVSTKYDYDRM